MEYKLDKDFVDNRSQYFFCLLGLRFEVMAKLMALALEKRYKVKFKPIYILSASPNAFFADENYIVINKQADILEKRNGHKVIYLQDYEDLNVEFVESKFVQEIANKLLQKQSEVFVFPFTTSFLESLGNEYKLIGPNSTVAKKYDDKVDQYELFEHLNLPRNKIKIFLSKDEVLRNPATILPFYISAEYTSGGSESGLIWSEKMLSEFFAGLREIN